MKALERVEVQTHAFLILALLHAAESFLRC
jgi:hypothetical protein